MVVPERQRLGRRSLAAGVHSTPGGYSGRDQSFQTPHRGWHVNSSCPSPSGEKQTLNQESCHSELGHTWGPSSTPVGTPRCVARWGTSPCHVVWAMLLGHPKGELLRAGMMGTPFVGLFGRSLGSNTGSALMQSPQLSRGPRCQQQQMTSKIAFQVQ